MTESKNSGDSSPEMDLDLELDMNLNTVSLDNVLPLIKLAQTKREKSPTPYPELFDPYHHQTQDIPTIMYHKRILHQTISKHFASVCADFHQLQNLKLQMDNTTSTVSDDNHNDEIPFSS